MSIEYMRDGWFPVPRGHIDIGGFCVTGYIIWEVWLHKHFWNEVRLGNIGINPKGLFAAKREYVN